MASLDHDLDIKHPEYAEDPEAAALELIESRAPGSTDRAQALLTLALVREVRALRKTVNQLKPPRSRINNR